MISISFLSITFIPFYSCWHFFPLPLTLISNFSLSVSHQSAVASLNSTSVIHLHFFTLYFQHRSFSPLATIFHHKTLDFHPSILTFFLSYLSASELSLNFVLSPDKVTQKIRFLSALISPVNWFPVLLSCHEDTHTSVGLQYSCTDRLIHQLRKWVVVW